MDKARLEILSLMPFPTMKRIPFYHTLVSCHAQRVLLDKSSTYYVGWFLARNLTSSHQGIFVMPPDNYIYYVRKHGYNDVKSRGDREHYNIYLTSTRAKAGLTLDDLREGYFRCNGGYVADNNRHIVMAKLITESNKLDWMMEWDLVHLF